MADDLKLKGPVREIGIERDNDRHDSFNITIGITIKTDGRVSYEEAERLSSKFRREYLGKDVEFRAIHIPCPHCDKILNSETGLKQHILKVHPEKAELLTPAKATARVEEPKKAGRGKKAGKPSRGKRTKKRRASAPKRVKAEKPRAAAVTAEGAPKKTRAPKTVARAPAAPQVKTDLPKPVPIVIQPPVKAQKPQQKTKQLTLY